MKRTITFLSSLLLAITSFFFMTGCGVGASIVGIHMSSSEVIDVPCGNFSYEGINVSVDFADGTIKEIPLAEDMISEVERLKFFKVGKQDVSVGYRNKFFTTMAVNVLLNQFQNSYELIGYECVYDGLPHYVTLNEELPEGAEITYPYGNMFTNAGTYEIVGVIAKDGYESKTVSTTLTIHQAEKDADGIVFEDATLIYNGEIRTIEATNVPEGVAVTYDAYEYDRDIRINKVVNAGKYRIVAHFTDESANYKKIPDKQAILTIKKADYDLSTIELKDVERVYDGSPYEAKIEHEADLPMGVTPRYSYLNEKGEKVNSNAGAGIYTIVCDFVGGDINNYNDIPSLKATLTVKQKTINLSNVVAFESKVVNFDEQTHTLAISGKLPEGVEVTYENNDKIYAGEYEVKAKFSATNPNETVDVKDMTAYLVINQVRRSVKSYNEETEAYDKDFGEKNISIKDGKAVVSGIDEKMFGVKSISFTSLKNYKVGDVEIGIGDKVEVNQMIDGDTYQYVVVFEYVGDYAAMNDSVIISNESDNFTYKAGA